ncbi:unnamed protein product [Sphagnum troendelagicum]|uniref:Uncharacterized protein n=1 Tax=Sphagnum jensenii TaxID=128206 RepID=A0ABP0WM69_9BRYO
MHHPLHVSADTRSCATRRDICSFAYFNAILERCVPTLARWLVSLAGKSSSSSALKQRTEFAASGSPPANGGDEVGADCHDGRSPPRCR